MGRQHDGERNSSSDALDLPSLRSEAAKINHTTGKRDGEEVHPLEGFEDLVVVLVLG